MDLSIEELDLPLYVLRRTDAVHLTVSNLSVRRYGFVKLIWGL